MTIFIDQEISKAKNWETTSIQYDQDTIEWHVKEKKNDSAKGMDCLSCKYDLF